MLLLALSAAALGLSSAQFYGDYGWHPNIACPYEPPRPRSGRDTCDWIPLKHPLSGCIMRWKCEEVEPSAQPCPEAPAKPTTGKNCNWVAMRDARGCILDYECEPVTQPPCPRRPQRPDNTDRCYYRAIKNNDGCVVDYECEPLGGGLLPLAAPRPYIAPRPYVAPLRAPLPAPLPTYTAPLAPIAPAAVAAPLPVTNQWAGIQQAAAASGAAALARAQAQANLVNRATLASATSLSAFAPRIPILKDDGATDSLETFAPRSSDAGKGGARGRHCVDLHKVDLIVEDVNTGRQGIASDCQKWALIGECENNSNYMMDFCARSCRAC